MVTCLCETPWVSSAHEPATAGHDYAARLQRLSGQRWKQRLDVQLPYRWNIRRLNLGRTLDLGCGIGRNLAHLDGNGIGVDHNPESVQIARERGLVAYTPNEFESSEHARDGAFDSLLAAHVVEHLPASEAESLIRSYLHYLRPQGRICLITPQELGYRTDNTHVRFVDQRALAELSSSLGLAVQRQFSFPFPRPAGRIFAYNEFVTVSRKQ